MPDFRHLFPKGTGTSEQYTSRTRGGGDFDVPPRDDRVAHAKSIIDAMKASEPPAENAEEEAAIVQPPAGTVLEFISDPGFKLKLESLEAVKKGIELRNVRVVDGVMRATVFIPEGKMGYFIKKFEAYLEEPKPNKKPSNLSLVESTAGVRLAALSSFWTDVGEFPANDVTHSWEIWLRELPAPENVGDVFRAAANRAGVEVSLREIKFPERRVLLAKAPASALARIENLFDVLAELRTAKILPAEFLNLPPRDQGHLITDALKRITPPAASAPAVSHLDTGVNRGHPLIEIALAEDALFTCNPTWGTDDRKGHGTEMAGVALYGDLTILFNSDEPRVLRHQLESVKIFPTGEANDPDLYGDITSQAVSLVEIAAPARRRALCLTITADSRDEGFPSSWSAAVDQICAGAMEEGNPRRLMFVSAGNTTLAGRHEYPNHNHTSIVEDPAQSFNAISVGAFTEMTTIHADEFADWVPIGEHGKISPCSRTSLPWEDTSWPLKPDIVMEGGNCAIDPNTQRADYVDDLSLLTTRLHLGTPVFTTTGDTSAAAALAARYAAIIWSHYPQLNAESVRALMIHSSRWTDAMKEEFPHAKRRARLRTYGYGVPNLPLALWSATNSATVIIEDSLQPYDKTRDGLRMKDMRLHRLPWPKDALEQLGDLQVRMRVTLSYFIEPSPGRRGWSRKQRYQSHGLRFAVKRPLETETDFRKRISKAAWDEGEESVESVGEDLKWQNGEQLHSKGSVHSDVWIGTAAELASSGTVAIHPVSGWWKDRPHLQRWNSQAPYSLVITLETDSTEVDLYTPIAQQIGVEVVAVIET